MRNYKVTSGDNTLNFINSLPNITSAVNNMENLLYFISGPFLWSLYSAHRKFYSPFTLKKANKHIPTVLFYVLIL